MTNQSRKEIDALLQRIHRRISDLEARLLTIEADAEREIDATFREETPFSPEIN